jgi:hypothetical protein
VTTAALAVKAQDANVKVAKLPVARIRSAPPAAKALLPLPPGVIVVSACGRDRG